MEPNEVNKTLADGVRNFRDSIKGLEAKNELSEVFLKGVVLGLMIEGNEEFKLEIIEELLKD